MGPGVVMRGTGLYVPTPLSVDVARGPLIYLEKGNMAVPLLSLQSSSWRPVRTLPTSTQRTAMPSTYRERVANILSEVAKDGEPSILLDTLIQRVRASIESEARGAGPRLRDYVLRAVNCERRSRRVKLHCDASDRQLITFTDSGAQYFREVGTFLLHDVDDRKFARLTIPELMNLRGTLLDITQDIRQVLHEHDPTADDSLDALTPTLRRAHDSAHSQVAMITETVKTLRDQNIELSAILADNRRAERELTQKAKRALRTPGDAASTPVASSSRHAL
ncbi:hypothetical protein PYCCODRAFT_1426757 [Trametes coccinea BRFM310]|uniref:Uncharacterized protein n=1 Tax=Trametes coccinea (strain BRFM310) TaxID=1353009 RepID=A0A1Y2IGA4_TRAC3|nr:hypothetical protein PYCCODRAFT_1426757 [Trametes coccinea BRFM310]